MAAFNENVLRLSHERWVCEDCQYPACSRCHLKDRSKPRKREKKKEYVCNKLCFKCEKCPDNAPWLRKDKLVGEASNNQENIPAFLKSKNNYFITPDSGSEESQSLDNTSEYKQTAIKTLIQGFTVKIRVLKRAVGIFFSIN